MNSYVGTTNWAKQLDLNVLDGTTGIKLVNVSVDASAGNVSIQGDKIVYTPAKKPDGSSQYNADISFDIEVDGKVYTGYKAVVVVTSPILIDITGIFANKRTITLDEIKT